MSVLGQPGSIRFVLSTGTVTAVLAGVILLGLQGGLQLFSQHEKSLTYSVYQSPEISGANGLSSFAVLSVTNESRDVANNLFVELRVPSGTIADRSSVVSKGVIIESEQKGQNSESVLIRELNPDETVKLSVFVKSSTPPQKPDVVVRAPGFLAKEKKTVEKTFFGGVTQTVQTTIAMFLSLVLSIFVVSLKRFEGIRGRNALTFLDDRSDDANSLMPFILARVGLHDLAASVRKLDSHLYFRTVFDMIFTQSQLHPEQSEQCVKALKFALLNPRLAKNSRDIALLYLQKLLPAVEVQKLEAELEERSAKLKSVVELRRIVLAEL